MDRSLLARKLTHLQRKPSYCSSKWIGGTVNDIIRKATNPYKGLLAYRHTVMEDLVMSPGQMFHGRRPKSELPTIAPLLIPSKQISNELKMSLKVRQQRNKYYYGQHCGKDLKSLKQRENWIQGEIVNK